MDSESALPGDVQEEMPEEDVADVLGRESHSAWQLALVLVAALVLNENGPQGHCVTKGEMSDIKLTLFSRNLTISPHHRRVGCHPPHTFCFWKGKWSGYRRVEGCDTAAIKCQHQTTGTFSELWLHSPNLFHTHTHVCT